jgi:hypothetical protein
MFLDSILPLPQDTEDEYANKDITPHHVSGDELFEAIKPMQGKSPWEYSDDELDRVIRVLRGATAIHMPGSSEEAYHAVSSFYGEFSEMVGEKPRLAAELDPFYNSRNF